MTVPPDTCKSAIYTYFDGFSFSVSVLFTIGFGTNGGDVFFGDCVWMQIIITAQVRLYDAFVRDSSANNLCYSL